MQEASQKAQTLILDKLNKRRNSSKRNKIKNIFPSQILSPKNEEISLIGN